MYKQITASLFFLFFVPSLFAQNSGNDLYDPGYLHEVKIYFDEPDFWTILTDNYNEGAFGDVDIEYLAATEVYIDGALLENVGVRQKGFSSHFASNDFKKSLKLDFDKFVEDQTYDGVRKVNLNNGVGDPGFMRDFLCYDMIRQTGAPAPRVAHAKVYLNDEYWGLYVLVEQVDKTFLSEHFDSNDGNLFKNIGWSSLEWLGTNPVDYQENFELKTNETENDWSGFINLHNVINNSSAINFPGQIQQYFNVPGYLKILAIDIMTDNWDSYIEHGRNFYLYEEPNEGKFHWLPWDYNLAMGGTFETFGNPQVLDLECPFFAEFSFELGDNDVTFTDESTDNPDSWFWDFGDGSISTEQNPEYIYPVEDIYEVCLTVEKEFTDTICSKTFCLEIDLTIDLSGCPTLISGACPYPPNDPILAEVMDVFDFCCDVDWDDDCQSIYDFFSEGPGSGGGGFGLDFPLLLTNPEKILINRLMNVDEFRELYLSYACDILETNFTTDRIYPIIDTQADIIREAVYEDPNYLFTPNYFEYDVGYGGQANGAVIPQVKIFIEDRIPDLQEDLTATAYDCTPPTSPISFNDIVINELVADNDSTSNITDQAGDFDDWIELYNNTTTSIDLSGFYLSDDSNDPYKWAFPLGTSIGGGEYLIVWADHQGAQDGLHADFQLNKSGEEIQLTYADGTIIDTVTFGEQSTNQGYARVPNGTGDFVIQSSTFQENNEAISATNNLENTLVKLYPNPTNNSVYIQLSNVDVSEKMEFAVFNSIGQMVLPYGQVINNNNTVTLGQFPNGLYRIAIRNEDGKVEMASVLLAK